jgi:hypothetical protein
LNSSFPTTNEILDSYVEFNEQHLVDYIARYADSILHFDEFLHDLVDCTMKICTTQHNNYFNNVKAATCFVRVELPFKQSKVFHEAREHLKNNFKAIMELWEEDVIQKIDQMLSKLEASNSQEFVDATYDIVVLLHELI